MGSTPHRLVVDQGLNRCGARLIFHGVHPPPELRPPLRHANGEGDVRGQRRPGDQHVLVAAIVGKDPGHQGNLQGGRGDSEDHGCKHVVDAAACIVGHQFPTHAVSGGERGEVFSFLRSFSLRNTHLPGQ